MAKPPSASTVRRNSSRLQPSPDSHFSPSDHPKGDALGCALDKFNQELLGCTRCPRLTAHREQIGKEKRRAYRDWEYWARPVPGFGPPDAQVLILGLAPGAHGSNRTGRMFTGDSSGCFLYRVLHATGFASQPVALRRDDGLVLQGCYITAVAHCAPPANRPTPEELATCASLLDRELALLPRIRIVVALGRIAFEGYLNYLKRQGHSLRKSDYPFAHGVRHDLPDGRVLLAAYHPSNQNTQTGKLTEQMLQDVFQTAARMIG